MVMVSIQCETGDDVEVEGTTLVGANLSGLNLHRALLEKRTCGIPICLERIFDRLGLAKRFWMTPISPGLDCPRASCRLCDVEPWAYLRDVFCLLPELPEHELLDLAPLRWTKTAARDDVRARLDANRFRAHTLDARG